MTRAKPSIQTTGIDPVCVDALDVQQTCKATQPISAIHLRWDLSLAAGQRLLRQMPSRQAARGDAKHSGQPVIALEMTITPTHDGQVLRVLLEGIDASGTRLLLRQRETNRWVCTREDRNGFVLDHVDVFSTVKCSVARMPRDGQHNSRVLFVRTHWLEALDIVPGSYALTKAHHND